MLHVVASLVVKGTSYGQESLLSEQVAPKALIRRDKGPRVGFYLLERPVNQLSRLLKERNYVQWLHHFLQLKFLLGVNCQAEDDSLV